MLTCTKLQQNRELDGFSTDLTLLHSERPKLYAILASLSAIGLKTKNRMLELDLNKPISDIDNNDFSA